MCPGCKDPNDGNSPRLVVKGGSWPPPSEVKSHRRWWEITEWPDDTVSVKGGPWTTCKLKHWGNSLKLKMCHRLKNIPEVFIKSLPFWFQIYEVPYPWIQVQKEIRRSILKYSSWFFSDNLKHNTERGQFLILDQGVKVLEIDLEKWGVDGSSIR